jgi:hypothetical protein
MKKNEDFGTFVRLGGDCDKIGEGFRLRGRFRA